MDPNTVVTAGLVFIVIAVAGGAVAIALWVNGLVSAATDVAAAEAATLARELSEYKLHVAETYMSRASGAAAMDRAVNEIKGLRTDLKEEIAGLRGDWKDELNKFGDRIERMENHVLSGRA